MTCPCGPDWTIEAFDLRTGRVLGVLPVQGLTAQIQLNKPSTGQLDLSPRDVPPRLVWPRLVGAGIMWQGEPVWVGWFEESGMSSNNTLRCGLKSLDQYPFHRHIDQRVTWNQISQTNGLASLVNRFADGIVLDATYEPSTRRRDRQWEEWDHNIVGDLMQDMTDIIDGPDWELRPYRVGGRWGGTIIFRDRVGEERPFQLVGGRDSGNFGITLNGQDLGTHQHAVGDGQEEEQLDASATDTSVYPRFDVTTGYSSVKRVSTLEEYARGRLGLYSEISAVPDMVIDGPDPKPSELRVGDIVHADLEYYEWAYRGAARIIGINYRATATSADLRTVQLDPLQPPSESVMVQTADNDCKDC